MLKFKTILPYFLIILVIVLFRIFYIHQFDNNNKLMISDKLIDFELKDHANKIVRLNEINSRYVVLAFGWSYCTTVCPRIWSNMLKIKEIYADEATSVFIALDNGPDIKKNLTRLRSDFKNKIVFLGESNNNGNAIYEVYMKSVTSRLHQNKNQEVEHSDMMYWIDKAENKVFIHKTIGLNE